LNRPYGTTKTGRFLNRPYGTTKTGRFMNRPYGTTKTGRFMNRPYKNHDFDIYPPKLYPFSDITWD
jgi:hypothetical protein